MESPNNVDDDEVSIDPDRISDLPDNVVSNILSLIPTKYAVRTSSLSTRLNPFRTFLVNLQFDDEFDRENRWSEDRSNSFKEFVSNILALQKPGLVSDKFHLRCTVKRSGGVSASDITTWVSEAVYRSLHLQIFSFLPVNVPGNVFHSTNLVNLNLDSEKSDLVVDLDENTKIYLPNLKRLKLISVTYVDEASVKRLFEGCPELEEVFVQRSKPDNIESCYCINCPKLKKVTVIFAVSDFTEFETECSIQITSPVMEYVCIWNDFLFDLSIEYLSSITEAHFCVRSFGSGYAGKLLNLLRGMTSVKHLSLSATTMAALACLPETVPPIVLKEDVKLDIGIENKLMLWPNASPRETVDLHRLLTKLGQRFLSQLNSESWWKEDRNRPKWLWEHISELYIFVPNPVFYNDENLEVLFCVLREVKVLKQLTIQTAKDLYSKTKTKVIEEIRLFSDCTIEFVV